MPLIQIKTNVMLPEKQREARLAPVSRLLAEITGKPETYCMVVYEHAAMLFAGDPGPAAFLDVRGIGGLRGATISPSQLLDLAPLLAAHVGVKVSAA